MEIESGEAEAVVALRLLPWLPELELEAEVEDLEADALQLLLFLQELEADV